MAAVRDSIQLDILRRQDWSNVSTRRARTCCITSFNRIGVRGTRSSAHDVGVTGGAKRNDRCVPVHVRTSTAWSARCAEDVLDRRARCVITLGKAVDVYLIDLKDKLEAVADLTTTHAKQAQDEYSTRYNLRARDKHFNEGDPVVVLALDNA